MDQNLEKELDSGLGEVQQGEASRFDFWSRIHHELLYNWHMEFKASNKKHVERFGRHQFMTKSPLDSQVLRPKKRPGRFSTLD